MKILVFGAGVIGVAYAWQLSLAGHAPIFTTIGVKMRALVPIIVLYLHGST